MTHKQNLETLLTKVKVGEIGAGLNTSECFPITDTALDNAMNAVDAFYGSMDAALSLLDAVLPEWTYYIERGFACVGSTLDHCSTNPVTSRALLISIIKTLIAETGK